MSHPKDDYDFEEINESEQNQTFVFDKFVQDLERREQLRREAFEKQPIDHSNRIRDARNREHLHNRLRWSR